REFVDTEEQKNWDYSCEVSDPQTGEDNSSAHQASHSAHKENIPIQVPITNTSVHIDSTLNLQTSIDVTLLPCELTHRNPRKAFTPIVQDSLHADSLLLSSDERSKMHNDLYNSRFMDKTMDLMSGSLVSRSAKNLGKKVSVETEGFSSKPATKSIGDSFMDITPLGMAPTGAPVPPTHQSFMELETKEGNQRNRQEDKENQVPTQKSIFVEMEEEKETKSQTQNDPVDIFFDCSLNVSEDRDKTPENNTFSSNNSTIHFKDESVLIPLDMIAGTNISKKINFQQLNDELEAGKIQIFPNGPKTPNTDRKNPRVWKGFEAYQADDPGPVRDMRNIKPRGTLNFSENMMMSPEPATPVPKEKDKLQVADDKRKYRFSQADELMLDNTNFLAHAKLGDETQSRNTSKSSTRREATFDNSVLDFPRLGISNRLDEPDQSKARLPSRQTLLLNESIDQEGVKAPHVRKEIDEEVVVQKETVTEDQNHHKTTVWECTKTRRRETLLMDDCMEVDIVSPLKELHLKPNHPKDSLKARHTLCVAEPVEEDVSPLKGPPAPQNKSKPRQTILATEPMEEDVNLETNNSYSKGMSRKTLVSEEPIVEEKVTYMTRSKSRKTQIMSDSIEEENEAEKAKEEPRNMPTLSQNQARRRHTLLQHEPMEEETNDPPPVSTNSKSKQRQTLLLAEPIDEETGKDSNNPSALLTKSKSRQTLLLTEPIEDVESPSFVPRSKPRQTLIMSEKIEEEEGVAPKSVISHPKSKRQTLLATEPIEEEILSNPIDPPVSYPKTKSRQTLLVAEPMEEESENQTGSIPESIPTVPSKQSKNRQTLLLQEPIEEEKSKQPKRGPPIAHSKLKPRQTLLLEESMEEEVSLHPKNQSIQNQADSSHTVQQKPNKNRQTLLLVEPIEEEANQNSAPPVPPPKLRSRQTMLLQESMEEDLGSRPRLEESIKKEVISKQMRDLVQNHKTRSQQTLKLEVSMEEEIKEEEPKVLEKTNPKTKSRQTLLLQESMEEDNRQIPLPLENSMEEQITKQVEPITQYPKTRTRQTFALEEPIEEESNKTVRDEENVLSKKKPRQTMLLEETIDLETDEPKPQDSTQAITDDVPPKEDSLPHSKLRHALFKPKEEPSQSHKSFPRNIASASLSRHEDMEMSGLESISWERKQTNIVTTYKSSKGRQTIVAPEPIELEQLKDPKAEIGRSFKARQTLVMAEAIEENEAAKPQEPIRSSKSGKTIVSAEPIDVEEIVDDQEEKVAMEHTMDFQSPQRTVRNTKSFAFTPRLSLTDFEQEEQNCKTPSRHRKQRTIVDMVLEANASRFGTPMGQGNLKRLPNHLTPNLPESKKRNTQLFSDSNMELDEEDVPGVEVPEPNKSRIPIRRTFKLDDSVQLVRDYQPERSRIIVPQASQSPPEEKPITISDVSKYFQEQAAEQRKSSCRDSGSSTDRTLTPPAVETIDLDADEPDDQLDNEKISLVSTMEEETTNAEEQPEPEVCEEPQSAAVVAGSSGSCRRCRNCRRSMNETELRSISFALPYHDPWDFSKELQTLKRLRSKPTLSEVHKNWELREKERQMHALEARVNESVEEAESWSVPGLMVKFKRYEKTVAESRESFFHRLSRLLTSQQPNWIFDYQLKCSRQLIFYHRLLPTFRIVVNYEVLDVEETAIRVCSISLDNDVAIPKHRWSVFYHYQDFQLSLNLPVNLSSAMEGSNEEAFLKFLKRIDQSCEKVKRTLNKLLTLLAATGARLFRQANRNVVRKTVWKDIVKGQITRHEKTNFLIEISNMDETSFRDIVEPSFHHFDEQIQHLPKGIAFLEAFLPNPEQFLVS
ncbi:hypothetical protein KR026_006721, partial [Drosophila bipectinata]